MLILAVIVAAALRFYRLGEWPPGPYRDEAFNGLDALGVLRGDHALFFPANNGREPVFIYLIAAAVALLGPTTLALRLPAAIAGVLTTIPTFLLAREWFGRAAGVLAALLWAITFWPVHLGRIGLRASLLAPFLALAFWLGTLAYRRQRAWLWAAAGAVYGASFYTYLAARFTPLVLLLLALYLVATGRRARLWDGGRVLWFVVAAAVVTTPFALLVAQQPDILFGRAGQVSILSPSVSGGNPAGALLSNTGRALGMFLWRGDAILRHNALLAYDVVLKQDGPAGRPVFDLFMAAPFLVGAAWCVWRWRRPAAAALLLWQLVMLGPTILAEDAPHFLRAAGLLPGAVLFPAIGLALLWEWPRLPALPRRALVALLLAGSLALTVRDYARYATQPDVGYLFESAAAELARSAAADSREAPVAIDARFWEGWPSLPYLLDGAPVTLFTPEAGLPPGDGARAVYAWPYDALDYLPAGAVGPAVVEVEPGPLARGDLERTPYALYTRYRFTPGEPPREAVGNFDNRFVLQREGVTLEGDALTVDLLWEPVDAAASTDGLPSLFIHVVSPDGLVAQYDGPLAGELWPAAWWRPSLGVAERHTLTLPEPFDPARQWIEVGLYWPDTGQRLPLLDARSQPVDDRLLLQP